MKDSRSDLFAWLDIETFGLDADDPILEFGIKITNLDLETVVEASWLVWDKPLHSLRLKRLERYAEDPADSTGAEYVLNMHTKNNLFDDAFENGIPTSQVDTEIAQFLRNSEVTGLPICGSSVSTDKTWMGYWLPEALSCFHYRIVDCSTLKEVCRRYNKRVYENLPPKAEEHRVMPDLTDTIREFRFYRDEFLLW
jgi:oligoribonuclease